MKPTDDNIRELYEERKLTPYQISRCLDKGKAKGKKVYPDYNYVINRLHSMGKKTTMREKQICWEAYWEACNNRDGEVSRDYARQEFEEWWHESVEVF